MKKQVVVRYFYPDDCNEVQAINPDARPGWQDRVTIFTGPS